MGAKARFWWRLILLVALIILVLAAVLFWAVRPAPGRSPLEFLPASTHAVVGCDLRPGSKGMRQALKVWGASDVKHLGARGADLAQGVVDWLGFALDVKKDILPWFGGELAIASVTGETRREWDRPFTPNSLVVVLRTKNMRRARSSLDRGVKPFAREANWSRATEKRAETRITVWRDMSGRARLAYALKDGCVLIANRPEVLGLCLTAAKNTAARLTYQDAFQTTVGNRPRETVAWSYFATDSLAQVGREILPGAAKGWAGLLSDYRNYASFGRSGGFQEPETITGESGALALSLSPVRDGAELHAIYRLASDEPARPPRPNRLAQVAKFAPEEAALSVALHNPLGWAKPLLPVHGNDLMLQLLLTRTGVLGVESPPEDLLLTALPNPDGGPPSLALAAPAEHLPLPPKGMLSRVFPKDSCAVVEGIAVLARDKQTLKQCTLAAKQGHPLADSPDNVCLVISARPGALFPALDRVKQLKLVARATPGGGEGEITLAIPPRYLLGFDSSKKR